MDQGSTRKRSAVHNFAPTVTKFCVMWEGLSLPHDTKFGNSRCEIVGRRVIFIWSLIHGLRWSGLIKVGPGPRFNIKMSSYRYRKSHCGDKTVVRSSYLHNGISYTGKMTSFYWIRALCTCIALTKWDHWGQPREATFVKMAPTRPLASRSFCLLAPLCDHWSLSFLYNNPRNIRRETTVGKIVRNNGRR